MNGIYNTFGIYRITNTLSGVSYIGKTGNSFGDRWDHHKATLRGGYHSNRKLQSDWNDYGEDAFEFVIIESVLDKTMLNDLEVMYIGEYKEKMMSYNVSDGGDAGPNLGKHLSEETKIKIGEKNRANMTGRKLSDETRKRMSEAQKRRIYSDEEMTRKRELSRAANLGRVRSEETKEKLRKINQANPPSAKLTPDDVKKIRDLKASGYKLSEIATLYSTAPSYISSIVHFRRWSHIR